MDTRKYEKRGGDTLDRKIRGGLSEVAFKLRRK